MPEGYNIREATPEDIQELAKLFTIARLVKSGPPDPFNEGGLRVWQNRDVALPLVACLESDSRLVVAAAEIHRLRTGARDMAQLEAVATDPGHEGNGLARAIIGRLFWYAQHVWGVKKLIWVSEAMKDRVRARHLYEDVIGAKLVDGSNSDWALRLPWNVPEPMRSHFVDHRLSR